MRWYAAEHIFGRGSMVVLCAAGAAYAGQGSVCVPHQLPAQLVVQGEAGQAGNGGHLVSQCHAYPFVHASVYSAIRPFIHSFHSSIPSFVRS